MKLKPGPLMILVWGWALHGKRASELPAYFILKRILAYRNLSVGALVKGFIDFDFEGVLGKFHRGDLSSIERSKRGLKREQLRE